MSPQSPTQLPWYSRKKSDASGDPEREAFLRGFEAEDDDRAAVARGMALEDLTVGDEAAATVGGLVGGAVSGLGQLIQGAELLPQGLARSVERARQPFGHGSDLLDRMDRGDQMAGYHFSKLSKKAQQAEYDKRDLQQQLASLGVQVDAPVTTSGIGETLMQAGESVASESRAKVAAVGGWRSMAFGAVPNAVGQSVPFLAAGGAAGMAGRALGLGAAAGTVGGVATAGSMAGFSSGFMDAKSSGADDQVALQSGFLNAGMGLTEAVPLAKVMARVIGRMRRPAAKIMMSALVEGGEEFLQESAQQIAGNLFARELYDAERKDLQGVLDSGAAGFFSGFLISAIGGGGGNYLATRAKARSTREQEAAAKDPALQPRGDVEPGSAPEKPFDPLANTITTAPGPQEVADLDEAGAAAVDRFVGRRGGQAGQAKVYAPSTPSQKAMDARLRETGARLVLVDDGVQGAAEHGAYAKGYVIVDSNAGPGAVEEAVMWHETTHHAVSVLAGAGQAGSAASAWKRIQKVAPVLARDFLADYLTRTRAAVAETKQNRSREEEGPVADFGPSEANLSAEVRAEEGVANAAEMVPGFIEYVLTNPEAAQRFLTNDRGLFEKILDGFITAWNNTLGRITGKKLADTMTRRARAIQSQLLTDEERAGQVEIGSKIYPLDARTGLLIAREVTGLVEKAAAYRRMPPQGGIAYGRAPQRAQSGAPGEASTEAPPKAELAPTVVQPRKPAPGRETLGVRESSSAAASRLRVARTALPGATAGELAEMLAANAEDEAATEQRVLSEQGWGEAQIKQYSNLRAKARNASSPESQSAAQQLRNLRNTLPKKAARELTQPGLQTGQYTEDLLREIETRDRVQGANRRKYEAQRGGRDEDAGAAQSEAERSRAEGSEKLGTDPRFSSKRQRRDIDQMGMYSALARAAEDRLPTKGALPGAQILATLKGTPGVKQEEIDWTGLENFLGPVSTREPATPKTRDEVLEFLRAQEPIVVESRRAGSGEMQYGDVGDVELIWLGEEQIPNVDESGNEQEFDETSETRVGYEIDGIQYYVIGSDWAGTWFAFEGETTGEIGDGETQSEAERLIKQYHFENHNEPADPTSDGFDGPVHHADWVLPGAKDNYRELLFVLPESAPNSDFDPTADHFAGTGYGRIAHARVDDRAVLEGGKPVEVLFAEEIQSDWHQRGRESGYKNDTDLKIIAALDRRNAAFREFTRQLIEATNRESASRDWTHFQEALLAEHRGTEAPGSVPVEVVRDVAAMPADRKESLIGLVLEARAAVELSERLQGEAQIAQFSFDRVPDAPFKKTWPEFVFKRLVALGIAEGKAGLAWTTGAQQADRYSLSAHVQYIAYRRVASQGMGDSSMFSLYAPRTNASAPALRKDVLDSELNATVGKEIADMIRDDRGVSAPAAADLEIKEIGGRFVILDTVGRVGDLIFRERSDAEQALERLRLGRDVKIELEASGAWTSPTNYEAQADGYITVRARLNNKPEAVEWKRIEGSALTVGGHGMRAFYDQMLVNYANKLGKPYGAKVDQRELARGGTGAGAVEHVHFLPFTEKMKASLAEVGLPRFALRRNRGLDPDRLASRRPKPQAPRQLSVPETNSLHAALAIVQDFFAPVAQAGEDVARLTKAPLPDEQNAALAENLWRGKAKERVSDVKDRFLSPILEVAAEAKIPLERIGEYLTARHAREYNAQIRKIDPANQAGSGMEDADADSRMAAFHAGPDATALRKIGKLVSRWVDDELRYKIKTGLVSQETAANFTAAYPGGTWVPQVDMPDTEDEAMGFGGSGFDMRVHTVRRLGRELGHTADNPLTFLSFLSGQAAIQGERAQVGQRLLKMLRAHPLENLARIDEPQTKRGIVKTAGGERVGLVRDMGYLHQPNVVVIREGGEDVTVEFMQGFQSLADAFKGLTPMPPGIWDHLIQAMGKITRFLGKTSVRWNPFFPPINAARDVGSVALLGTAEHGAAFTKAVLGGWVPAAREIATTRKDRSKRSARMRLWQESGGPISFLDLAPDVAAKAEDLERAIREFDGQLKSWEKVSALFEDTVGAFSDAIEQATRFAVFNAGIDVLGLSPEKAAALSKNQTLNFEKKGQIGQVVNALYLFAGAGINGTARLALAATRDLPSGRRVRRMLVGLVAFGALLDALGVVTGGDDDDGVPRWDDPSHQFEKRTNAVLLLPSGRPVKLPLPYGLNWFVNLGQTLSAATRHAFDRRQGKDAGQAVGEIFSTFLDAFNPFGGSGPAAQIVSPTPIDPLTQIWTNTTWTGSRLRPEARFKGQPESERAWKDTNQSLKDFARWLNRMGGGTVARPSPIPFMDVSPETLKLWAKTLTGGLGGELMRLGGMAADPGASTFSQVPLVRRIVGTPAEDSRWEFKFRDVSSEIDADFLETKGQKTPQARKIASWRSKKNEVKREVEKLRDQFDEQVEIDAEAAEDTHRQMLEAQRAFVVKYRNRSPKK